MAATVTIPKNPDTNSSAWKTVITGRYHGPSPMENLTEGISFVTYWAKGTPLPIHAQQAMVQWLHDAQSILANSVPTWAGIQLDGMTIYSGPTEPPPTMRSGKLPPMYCKCCNMRNEYVGQEHLQRDGSYVCRQCRKSP